MVLRHCAASLPAPVQRRLICAAAPDLASSVSAHSSARSSGLHFSPFPCPIFAPEHTNVSRANAPRQKLLKPVYGLNDACYIWYESLKKKIVEIFGAVISKIDPCVFYANNSYHGMIATQVDDLLMTGDSEFERREQLLLQVFEMKDRDTGNFVFSGLNIHQNKDNITVDMHTYIDRIQHLEISADFDSFRKMRGKVLWLATNCRPDLSFGVAMLVQVTQEMFASDKHPFVSMLNELVSYVHGTRDLKLRYSKLDINSLRVVLYTDGSFANNMDLSSQLGFIIVLMDNSKHANIIAWKSGKSVRVVHSTMAAETMAVGIGFDMAFGIRQTISDVLGASLKLVLFTDNKGVFDTITKRTSVTEKRIMIELAVLREAYEKKEISSVGFIRSAENPADGLTKRNCNGRLLQLMMNPVFEHPVEEWLE